MCACEGSELKSPKTRIDLFALSRIREIKFEVSHSYALIN